MDDKKMAQELVKTAQAFSNPIDLEKLIKEGIITQKGRSYYITDISLLPKDVSKRIKSIVPTRNGLKVSFYKESKRLKKIAEQYSHLLEEDAD